MFISVVQQTKEKIFTNFKTKYQFFPVYHLNAGVLLLYAGVLLLNAGVLLLNAGVLLLNAGVLLLNAGVILLNAGVLLLNTGVLLLNTGVLLLNTGVRGTSIAGGLRSQKGLRPFNPLQKSNTGVYSLLIVRMFIYNITS